MYHFVFVAKYRRLVITEEVDKIIQHVCIEISKRFEICFLEIGAERDHVHFLIQSVPSISPTKIVTIVKSITAREISSRVPPVKEPLWGCEFWTDGYFVSTVGEHANEDVIRHYLKKSAGMDRIELIRMKEKEYHDACYGKNELYQEGTWLKKPAKIILNELNRFTRVNNFSALDLGCGIGRHSIPIAMSLKGREGDVVCVDMLDSAIVKLEEYGRTYDVNNYLTIIKSSIEEFSILEDGYNMIVAVSSLEHLITKDFLKEKLLRPRLVDPVCLKISDFPSYPQ
jgi:REP element-mobilizing transposase RayT